MMPLRFKSKFVLIVPILLSLALGYWIASAKIFFLAAISGLAFIFLVAMDPKLALITWLIVAPFNQFYVDPFSPYRWFRFFLHFQALPLIGLALFLRRTQQPFQLTRYEILYILFLIYMLVSFLSTWGSPASNEVAWRTLLFSWGLPFFALLAGRHFGMGWGLTNTIVFGFIAMSIVVSASTIAENLSPVKFFLGSFSGLWDDVPGGRASGPLANPVPTGYIAQVGMLFALYWALRKRTPLRVCIAVISIALVGAATFLGFTRSTWLSFLAGALVLMWPFPRMRFWSLIGIGVLIIVYFTRLGAWLPQEIVESRIYDVRAPLGRLAIAYTGWRMFSSSPFLGQGFGSYDFQKAYFSPTFSPTEASIVPTSHNVFLTILAELGLMGFLPYMVALVLALKPGISRILRSKSQEDSQLLDLMVLLGGVVIYLINAMMIDMRFFSYAQCLFLLNVGLFYGISLKGR